MTRYAALRIPPRADLAEDRGLSHWLTPASLDVYVTEAVPAPTGLLNAEGIPLYRLPDRVPCGFRGPTRPL